MASDCSLKCVLIVFHECERVDRYNRIIKSINFSKWHWAYTLSRALTLKPNHSRNIQFVFAYTINPNASTTLICINGCRFPRNNDGLMAERASARAFVMLQKSIKIDFGLEVSCFFHFTQMTRALHIAAVSVCGLLLLLFIVCDCWFSLVGQIAVTWDFSQM